MTWSERIFFVLLLLFATGLRFVGLDFGRPDDLYFPSYAPTQTIHQNTVLQPDEYQFVTPPLRMALTGSLNPEYYINPPLPTYITYLHIQLTGSATGLSHADREGLNEREYAPFWIYFVARVHSALLGVLTVAVTYVLARMMGGRYSALFAGVLITVLPLLIQYAHYAKNSGIATGLSVLCVWASLMALRSPRWRWWLLMLAGIAIGASSASRYNASPASIVLCLVGIILYVRQPHFTTAVGVLGGWLLFPLTFLISIPAIIFAFDQFWYGFTYGFNHYITGLHVTNAGQNVRIEVMRYLFVSVLSLPVVVAMFWGIVVTIPRKLFRRNFLMHNSPALDLMLIMAYLVPYVWVVLNPTNLFRSQELLLPILPVLIVFAGLGAGWIIKHINTQSTRLMALPLLMLILIAQPIVMTLQFNYLIIKPDTRELMQQWLYEQLPAQARIHLVGSYNVALDESFFDVSQTYDQFISFDELLADGVDYVVVSDAYFNNIALTDEVGTLEVVAQAKAYIADYLQHPDRLAWIDRPQVLFADNPLHLASYYHNPSLYVICINPSVCSVSSD
ncbi:MAG: ArnT family glycosyltransferase [Anaerolineae bacterium]